MKTGKTARGFVRDGFTDRNGVECSLQKSSLATEDAIWLGCNDIGLKRFTPETGWEDVLLDSTGGAVHLANTRMHLTREIVAELLPHLQHFAETGELP